MTSERFNYYAYAGLNPPRFKDPFGLAKGDWWEPILHPVAFYRDAERIRRESLDRYGNAPTADFLRHMEASRRVALEYGPNWARMAGLGNELQGFLWWDVWRLQSRLARQTQWAADPLDLLFNEIGIWSAIQEKQCAGN